MNKLVRGVGVNDADYKVTLFDKLDGVWKQVWQCPFYVKWSSMLERCYSKKYHDARSTYEDCAVCTEWLTFSNFKSWMEQQNWEGKHLDKDLLVLNNKVYSPETCIFLTLKLNTFISGSDNKELPQGVSFKKVNRYSARCNHPFTGKSTHIGYYNTPEEAHQAWKAKKHEYACQLAELETDERVKQALKTRYL